VHFIFLSSCVLFLWWSIKLPFVVVFLIYIVFYFAKVVCFFTINKSMSFLVFVELCLMILMALNFYHEWGAIICSLSIFFMSMLCPIFYRVKDDIVMLESSSEVLLCPQPENINKNELVAKIYVNRGYIYANKKYAPVNNKAFDFFILDRACLCKNGSDADVYTFICNLQAAMPGSKYSRPLLKEHLGDLINDEVYAFYERSKNFCGLVYKETCLVFSAEHLNCIVIVEYTCRWSIWHSVALIYKGNVIEIEFIDASNKELVYPQLATSLAELWNVELKLEHVNLN